MDGAVNSCNLNVNRYLSFVRGHIPLVRDSIPIEVGYIHHGLTDIGVASGEFAEIRGYIHRGLTDIGIVSEELREAEGSQSLREPTFQIQTVRQLIVLVGKLRIELIAQMPIPLELPAVPPIEFTPKSVLLDTAMA